MVESPRTVALVTKRPILLINLLYVKIHVKKDLEAAAPPLYESGSGALAPSPGPRSIPCWTRERLGLAAYPHEDRQIHSGTDRRLTLARIIHEA